MEKILKVKYYSNENRYGLDEPGLVINCKFDFIENSFRGDIPKKIKKFYSNPINKDKEYNLVLLTDDELNKLEKISKQ